VLRFHYQSLGGRIEGKRVDRIRIAIDGKQPNESQLIAAKYQLRLVVHGKHVVMLLGPTSSETSGTGKLVEVLRHLKAGAAGLPEHDVIVDARRRLDPSRKLEFYLCLENLLKLRTINDKPDVVQLKPVRHVTAATLAVDAKRIQLDLWLPISEIKAIVAAAPQLLGR
jgi:hypothetical protein